MKQALFIVDTESGQGHQVRSKALAQELMRRGWWSQILPLGAPTYAGQDPAVTSDRPAFVPDVTILDAPWDPGVRPTVDTSEVTGYSGKLVVIVDTPGIRHADMIVCGGAGADPDWFPHKGNRPVVLAGPQYALLRREFRARCEDGGHDGGTLDVRAIDGWGSDELACKMAAAGIVITHGGMRAMEAACVGAPMVVVSRNEGEHINGATLSRHGAIWIGKGEQGRLSAKEHADEVEGRVTTAIAQLREEGNLGERGAMLRALVDGLGCQRVADAIEALV